MDNRYQLAYQKKLNRKSSQIDLLSGLDSNTSSLHESRYLGSGTYGEVRLFEDDTGFYQAAVKKPKDSHVEFETESEASEEVNSITTEFNYLKTANPHHAPYGLFFFDTHKKNQHTVDYRMVIPFSPGQKLNHALAQCSQSIDVARLFLRVTQELHRIHEQGIIHGDVGCRNILVDVSNDDFVVSYIDFGLAYPANGKAGTGFIFDKESSSVEMAPERYGEKSLKAHPNQDVYSLATTFNNCLKDLGPKWRRYLYQVYPSIKGFIEAGMSVDPKQRPTLFCFMDELQRDIILKAVPDDYHKFVHNLLDRNHKAAKNTLSIRQRDFKSSTLNTLFYYLMKERRLDEAKFLLSQNSSIPIEKSIESGNVFHMVAEWGDHYLNEMNMLFSYVSKRKVIQALNHQNMDGDTPLHVAAKHDQLGMIVSMLKHNPDVTCLNKNDKSPVDVAKPRVYSLLALKHFISSMLNQQYFSFSNAGVLQAAQFLLDSVLTAYPNPAQLTDVRHQEHIDKSSALKKIYNDLAASQLIHAYPEANKSVVSYLKRALYW